MMTRNRKNSEPFKKQRYILSTLDPVHVGAGGYRMDRLDNTIIRDVDNLPKVPGSSLSGAIRSYATLQSDNVCENLTKQCGKCEICQVFGYTGDEGSRKGLVSFYDARIWLFPVATMVGPVWVTTTSLFAEVMPELADDLKTGPHIAKNEFISLSDKMDFRKLNLGWLLLSPVSEKEETKKIRSFVSFKSNLQKHELTEKIWERVIFIDQGLFIQIVNDNLEVRTSVSIDPLTGAAIDGALFTYEAIPRSTFLWFDIVLTNPANYNNDSLDYMQVEGVLKNGITLLEHLGVGGMTTRGFGRVLARKLPEKGGNNNDPEQGN